jgi:glycosyltransferase involved in cell wall biosynthesis
MACGVPVITSNATAGIDIIEHEKDGFITDLSEDALCKTMEKIITKQYNLFSIAINAQAKALKYSWDAYGNRWKQIIDKVINDRF